MKFLLRYRIGGESKMRKIIFTEETQLINEGFIQKMNIASFISKYLSEKHCDKLWSQLSKIAKKEKVSDQDIDMANKQFKKLDLEGKRDFLAKVVRKAKNTDAKKYQKTEDKFQKKIDNLSNESLKEELTEKRHKNIVSAVTILADLGSFVVMVILSMALGIYGLAAWAVSFILSGIIGSTAGHLTSNAIEKHEEKKYYNGLY